MNDNITISKHLYGRMVKDIFKNEKINIPKKLLVRDSRKPYEYYEGYELKDKEKKQLEKQKKYFEMSKYSYIHNTDIYNYFIEPKIDISFEKNKHLYIKYIEIINNIEYKFGNDINYDILYYNRLMHLIMSKTSIPIEYINIQNNDFTDSDKKLFLNHNILNNNKETNNLMSFMYNLSENYIKIISKI